MQTSSSQGVTLRACAALTATLCDAPCALAEARPDIDLFNSIPHTLIDFETRGDGTPVGLPQGQTDTFDHDEYISFGVRFGGFRPRWANPSAPEVDAAQTIGGSGEIFLSLNASLASPPVMVFPDRIRSVGFFFVLDNTIIRPTPMTVLVSLSGEIVEQVLIDESFVTGTIGFIDYGWVTITRPEDFSAITFLHNEGVIFDDLRFSNIPSPGAAPVLILAVVPVALRRR